MLRLNGSCLGHRGIEAAKKLYMNSFGKVKELRSSRRTKRVLETRDSSKLSTEYVKEKDHGQVQAS